MAFTVPLLPKPLLLQSVGTHPVAEAPAEASVGEGMILSESRMR